MSSLYPFFIVFEVLILKSYKKKKKFLQECPFVSFSVRLSYSPSVCEQCDRFELNGSRVTLSAACDWRLNELLLAQLTPI